MRVSRDRDQCHVTALVLSRSFFVSLVQSFNSLHLLSLGWPTRTFARPDCLSLISPPNSVADDLHEDIAQPFCFRLEQNLHTHTAILPYYASLVLFTTQPLLATAASQSTFGIKC